MTAVFANAQQTNYQAFFETLDKNSANSFKDIMGTENEEEFYQPCTLKPEIGVLKIHKGAMSTELIWEIPLAQYTQAQKEVKAYIDTKYGDKTKYQSASEGTEEEGQIWTNVYELKANERPHQIFQTIYYRNDDNPEKSNFSIVFYGK